MDWFTTGMKLFMLVAGFFSVIALLGTDIKAWLVVGSAALVIGYFVKE